MAQARQAVSELSRKLRADGKTVRFAIHPVAGRLPGHMNVLPAEARVPYDIVNPAAQADPNSPIAGTPVLEVWKAKKVFVSERGQGTSYSGIENPLFFRENAQMLFGDAKEKVEQILREL